MKIILEQFRARFASSGNHKIAKTYFNSIRSLLIFFLTFFAFLNTSFAQPSWSRGEQLLSITFEEAMLRADAALKAEGFVNIYTQANIKAGYKGVNTAVILCNNAPEGKQWVNIVVSSNSSDGAVPGAERVKLQERMNQSSSGNVSMGSIDWYKSAEEYRNKIGQRFSFTCPTVDYIGHRLYGSDIYTDDSSICAAAVHAGVISYSGGMVTIEIKGAQNTFQGGTRNGAASSGYGYWPGSFGFVR